MCWKERDSFSFSGAGFVEYVESRSVASVVSEYGSILRYLNSLATKNKGARSVVADFTKSCGEFCRALAPLALAPSTRPFLSNDLCNKREKMGASPPPVSPLPYACLGVPAPTCVDVWRHQIIHMPLPPPPSERVSE